MDNISTNTSTQINSSNVVAHVLRFLPDQDLYEELLNYLKLNNIQAATIISCVGSLKKINLRTANSVEFLVQENNFEILSLVGCVSVERCHIHICLGDKNGNSLGGHLLREGNIIYTTAEIVLGVFPELKFNEKHCEKSGWPELNIEKLN